MSRWQKSLVAVLIISVTLLLIAYLLPYRWHVTRNIVIAAPTAKIFPYLADLHQWPKWTTWNENSDRTSHITFSGSPSGVGASIAWTGEKIGEGQLTITKSDPSVGVYYLMTMKDFQQPTLGSITMQTVTDGTKVEWIDEGELGSNPIHRYFGLLIDPILGTDLEKGLAKLKEIVENKNSK